MKRKNVDKFLESMTGVKGIRSANSKIFIREYESKMIDGKKHYITMMFGVCVTDEPLVSYTEHDKYANKDYPLDELWFADLTIAPSEKFHGGPADGWTSDSVLTNGGLDHTNQMWKLHFPEAEADK
jgi:hypothetical protein